jgi:hypothetical protein
MCNIDRGGNGKTWGSGLTVTKWQRQNPQIHENYINFKNRLQIPDLLDLPVISISFVVGAKSWDVTGISPWEGQKGDCCDILDKLATRAKQIISMLAILKILYF